MRGAHGRQAPQRPRDPFLETLSDDAAERLLPEIVMAPPNLAKQIRREVVYLNYMPRQAEMAAAVARDAAEQIGEGFDYASIGGLSTELRKKLEAVRPVDLGQASRIEGMTPAALVLIHGRLRHNRRNGLRG